MALAAVLSCCTAHAGGASEPLEPAAALADFRLPDGFCIELVAAEPEVVDPVAIAFDAQNRLWVVEMRDYPVLGEGAAPASRIRILEDRNGDGRFETARTFADGLLFPTGLQLWGTGAFVTLAGEIAYFPDDNNDGRADHQETWYEGFAEQNEQLRANHPTLAADGWIYVAGGLRGGLINNHRRPAEPPLNINGRDFAFNPRTGQCRAVSGNGQFGMSLDDFGRRFTCSNRNPLMQVMIEQRYLELNPRLIVPGVVHDVAAAGIESRLFPRSRALTTSAQHAGQFTAACGVEICSDQALAALPGRSSAFICEPTANLVHREVLAPKGAALTAQRVDQNDEFLTAADEWFRPVNLYAGPDAALYVVDMYRAIIEHPEWMPEELRNRPDLRLGNDRGRIYRVRSRQPQPSGASIPRPLPSEPERLVELVAHPTAWTRATAMRLLLEANADAALPKLQEMAQTGRSPSARRLALAILDAQTALPPQILLAAFNDPFADVRQQALILAEPHVGSSPQVAAAMLLRASDSEPHVRYQAALSSMFLASEPAAPALIEIARRDSLDEWTCRAIALAAKDRASALLIALLPSAPGRNEAGPSTALSDGLANELMRAVVAAGGPAAVAAVLEHLPPTDPVTSRRILVAAAEALEARRFALAAALAIVQGQNRPAHNAIVQLFDAALNLAADDEQPEADRISAVHFLRIDGRSSSATPLVNVLSQPASPALKLAVLDSLRRQTGAELPPVLLQLWSAQSPSVRRAIVELLASRAEWSVALLAAAESDDLLAAEIDPASRLKLLEDADPDVQRHAERLFGAATKDREEVVGRYQAALKLTGDVQRGRQVFAASCSGCHRIGADGVAIGPDIGDSSMKSSAQLLTDILDPNRAIDANYINYTALTSDGLAHQGLIRSESDGGVMLVGPDGKTVSILREELLSLSSGRSLMPEGLEQQISPPQMADLLVYLKTWRHAEDLRNAAAANRSAEGR
ncbi:MAG: c-type cytochrome [Pirellulales bacterium]|nr:c-type cytochrome [Pirellulales bacterium]